MNQDARLHALKRSIHETKVQRARQMPEGSKLLEGLRLFDQVRRRMINSLRSENPNWTDEEVHAELQRRFAIQRQIGEQGIYQKIGTIPEDGSIVDGADDGQ